jgi:EAL domain-containing protein (putative c-di-GMP-specific phosphodiesterase class I)
VLADTGLPAERLTVELTESALAGDCALDLLRSIRNLGVRVALDDFGTGYSSLSYLQRYPFDAIKIDRSFTSQLGDTPTAQGIVRSVLQLAEVLDTDVVGEGVETAEQARFLTVTGCRFAQGYWFGRPAPPEQLTDLLRPLSHQADSIN